MMPKNSRRKKAARQRAARHGESYTRALRAVGSIGTQLDARSTAEPETEFDVAAWERDLEEVRAVQQVLEARGWVADPAAHEELDAHGRVTSMDGFWDYPAEFGVPAASGDNLDDDLDRDDLPRAAECSFAQDSDAGFVVVVETAGNWRGCRRHRTVRHTLPMDESTTARLPQLLATVESAARVVDPGLLLGCTLRGRAASGRAGGPRTATAKPRGRRRWSRP